MPPEEEEEGGKMGTAFSWQARTSGVRSSYCCWKPPAKPGLAWLESVRGSHLVSHASFYSKVQ